MKKLTLLLSFVFVFSTAICAQADTFGFDNISANNVLDAAIGEAQLFVNVTGPAAGQVLFTFGNTGPLASSITDVYFDDGSLLGIASIINSTGVAFSQFADPGNLPAANNADPDFVTTAGFSADSDAPAQPNGVNPGESLGILFNLQGTQTFADVLSELGDSSLRIGIHVQGFASGGSEAFVNDGPTNGNGTTPVPEPATMLLLGSGLIGLVGYGRKKFFKK